MNIISLIFYLAWFSVNLTMFAKLLKSNGTKRKIYFVIILTNLVLLSGMRSYVGTDYKNYSEMYWHLMNQDIAYLNKYYLELLGTYVIHFSQYLGLNVSGMFIAFSLITYTLFFIFVRLFESDDEKLFAFYIFLLVFVGQSFNIIRNVISMLCFIIAIKLLLKDKSSNIKIRWIRALEMIVIIGTGFLFHKTIVIWFAFLAYYLIVSRFGVANRIKIFSYVFFLLIVLTYFSPEIVQFLANAFSLNIKYLTELPSKSYGFILYTIPVVIPIVHYYRYFDKKLFYNKTIYFTLSFYLFSIPLQLLGNSINSFDRLAIYGMGMQLILVPIFLNTVRGRKDSISNIYLVYYLLWYFVYFVLMYFVLGGHGIFPYRFVI